VAGVALIAASRAGARLTARLGKVWPQASAYVLARYVEQSGAVAHRIDGSLKDALPDLFARHRALVFFLPVGAVVRLIAPHLEDKRTDPAVVAVDDGGRFAVSLLSGHAGGANALAERVAALLGATPVVTTAVERRGLVAPEQLGLPFGWKLEAGREALLRVSAALVNGEEVGIYQDGGSEDWLLEVATRRFGSLTQLAESDAEAAIAITDRAVPASVADRYVVWRPRELVAGMGCSTGALVDELAHLLGEALEVGGLAVSGVGLLATLDRKLAEPGLRELAGRLGVELRGYAAAELEAVAVPNPSEIVRRAVGTPSVAEAAALLASGGALVVGKRASAHGTVAIAARGWDRGHPRPPRARSGSRSGAHARAAPGRAGGDARGPREDGGPTT
jgi:cobalt-precorrin 5A hydrolase